MPGVCVCDDPGSPHMLDVSEVQHINQFSDNPSKVFGLKWGLMSYSCFTFVIPSLYRPLLPVQVTSLALLYSSPTGQNSPLQCNTFALHYGYTSPPSR